MFKSWQIKTGFYIILYNLVCWIEIILCNLYISGTDGFYMNLLIEFVDLLSWIVTIVGAIRSMPPNPYSSVRVFYYMAGFGGMLGTMHWLWNLLDF